MARPRPGSTIVRGALVAQVAGGRAQAADILVTDGVIVGIGAGLAAHEGARVMDARGLLAHPGLVNAHTHSNSGLSKGMAGRWTLELLLAAGSWTAGHRLLADKKLATQICAAEMVLKGCTAAYDLYNEFPLPTREGIDAAAEAYAEIGMRAVIAPQIADKSLYEAIPGLAEAMPPDLARAMGERRRRPWEETLAAVSGILAHWRWHEHDIRPAIAPTIPLFCSDEMMCGCAFMAREHGVGLHSHVSESKVQALGGRTRYGKSIVAHLDGLGLLGPDFTAAHAIWLDDEDLRRMADRGASIAHNPGSNMRLGNGIFGLRRALDLGITVGIGTDGASCSDHQNMYEAMRMASLSSAVRSPDPADWASVEEVFAAATLGSARAMGFEDVGALLPGYKADIVFLDLSSVNWIPHNDTLNQLVHVEGGHSVRHVMIGGRMVVEDKVLLTVSLDALALEAERARERLEAANAAARAAFPALERAILDICPPMAAAPYPAQGAMATGQ